MAQQVGAPVHDCGAHPPESLHRRRIDPETGDQILEKLPPGPYKTMLDKAGHVRRIKLTCGAALLDPHDAYGRRKVRSLELAGAIPYYECPLTRSDLLHHLPRKMREGTPCSAGTFGTKIGPCKHVQELERLRKAKNQELGKREAERQKSYEQRNYELAMAKEKAREEREANGVVPLSQVEALVEKMVSARLEAMTAPKKGKNG